jgi:CHRD domain-containing protein
MRTRVIVTLIAAAVVAAAFTAGALAGTKDKPGDPPGKHKKAAKAPKAKHSRESRALFAVLRGRNEVGTDGRRGAGDPDGRGSFTAIVDGNQLCFGVTVTNLDQPNAAHIHSGRRNANGPVVIPLTQPSAGDPGAASGCVTVDPALAADILKHPHKYYANVHTAAFPNGAVRGQLNGKQR